MQNILPNMLEEESEKEKKKKKKQRQKLFYLSISISFIIISDSIVVSQLKHNIFVFGTISHHRYCILKRHDNKLHQQRERCTCAMITIRHLLHGTDLNRLKDIEREKGAKIYPYCK